ncbi:MAG TPA: glutamine--fructose-6-phosphate transaminase (isomerizing) [Candidatus Aenigmarchaeota archaeon]|nr:glutamine--fructose-6-phosphate transaminase (isomerizing) [Candidatus Aenigmarchaeota archaeon]
MCGIIGMVCKEKFESNDVIKMLKRLEYRGYDSFGIATDSGLFEKEIGEIKAVQNNFCKQAISHTRWSTHGRVTKANAHPHKDCTGNITIVHNGIIENYLELKKQLPKHVFVSETDTEVIAHYLEEKTRTKPIRDAITDFMKDAQGTFSVVVMIKGDENLYAFKRGSPLSLGLMKDGHVIASDIYAFSDKTDKAIFFNEDEFAIVTEKDYEFYRLIGNTLNPVTKDIITVKWSGCEEKKNFNHYMIKEIYEEPAVVERLINSLNTEQNSDLEKMKKLMTEAKRIVFVASGTSYHATLLGVYFLNKVGVEAHAIIASEFRNFYLVDKETLIVAVTQSGETMDVIEALHGMKDKGAKIASLVNVPYSTIQRMSNVSINIEAGQEICVAATKSFVNQVVCLAYLASMFEKKNSVEQVSKSIKHIFSQEEKIKQIAKSLAKHDDIYVIGRGFLYPIAREIALKIKEISYIHAEGMMGGELKHGTLALIEEGTPVLVLMGGKNEIVSNAMEVKARGGRIIEIGGNGVMGEFISIDAEDKLSSALSAAVIGQLLTYYIALEKGLPIDKPRNLAKVCTTK